MKFWPESEKSGTHLSASNFKCLVVGQLSQGRSEHTSSLNTDNLYNKLSPGRRDEYDSLGVKKTDDDIEMGGKNQHRRNKPQDRVYTSLQRDKMGEAYSEIGKKGERHRGKGNDAVYQGLSAATKGTYDVLQMQPVQTPY
ncbi:hypothetical protein JD844_032875 [Phrynosoma platyrhinos]|uniref:Uncharacterized protein n=1 Tax=Phrynosoma platyrhinos TaxID=52577 RepID=A0ABQ7T5S5_PHRPL|nr:hypothetical protein JD844_032875 [Phrynosoma platyrhinos]